MEIKNIKELLAYRNGYTNKLNEKILLLENLKGFKSKEAKKKLIIEIEIINNKLSEIESLLKKTTNFKRDEFKDFMTNILCLTEGSYGNYTYTVYRNPEEKIFFKKNKEKIYHLICKKDTIEYIKENIYYDYEFINFINDSNLYDVTLFEEEIIYPFNLDLTIRPKYARYPKLKNAIYELIQLKLDNPDITDEERYQIVIANTFKRTQNRYYNQTFEYIQQDYDNILQK